MPRSATLKLHFHHSSSQAFAVADTIRGWLGHGQAKKAALHRTEVCLEDMVPTEDKCIHLIEQPAQWLLCKVSFFSVDLCVHSAAPNA